MSLDHFRREQQLKRTQIQQLSEDAEKQIQAAEHPLPYWESMDKAMAHITEILPETWNVQLRNEPKKTQVDLVDYEIRRIKNLIQHETIQDAFAVISRLRSRQRGLQLRLAKNRMIQSIENLVDGMRRLSYTVWRNTIGHIIRRIRR